MSSWSLFRSEAGMSLRSCLSWDQLLILQLWYWPKTSSWEATPVPRTNWASVSACWSIWDQRGSLWMELRSDKTKQNKSHCTDQRKWSRRRTDSFSFRTQTTASLSQVSALWMNDMLEVTIEHKSRHPCFVMNPRLCARVSILPLLWGTCLRSGKLTIMTTVIVTWVSEECRDVSQASLHMLQPIASSHKQFK